MRIINDIGQTAAMINDVFAKNSSNHLYNLAAGDPDQDIQFSIWKNYYKQDLSKSHNYGSSQGNLELRTNICEEHPDNVVISNGSKQLLYMALDVITNPQDQVILIGPCWSSYMKICELLNLKFDVIVGSSDSQYIPTMEQIQKKISASTRAILLNNPNNPTGVIYSKEFINSIYRTCQDNDCWFIVDEIYKDLCYDKEFFSSSELNSDRVLTIDGFSKSYNITGWRIGYCFSLNNDLIHAIINEQSQLSGPPNSLIQQIVADSYSDMKSTNKSIYQDRINLLADLNDKFRKHKPEAGFYFYIPIEDSWKDTTCLCQELQKEQIIVTPGDDYGIERTIRISIANINSSDLFHIKDRLLII